MSVDKITIIVPCYNEEEVLPMFWARVPRVLADIEGCSFSYIFVNDGSHDGTLDELRRLSTEEDSVSYISFSRNFGKEAAMLAGLDRAEGDAVVLMDADLQHPPELIAEMVKWWRDGYDDVAAKRANRADEGFIKGHVTNFFYYCLQKCSRFEVQRNVGDFRLLDRRCVMALRLMREEQRYTKGIFTWIGYRKKEIPFHVAPRAGGKTTWNYFSLMNLALEGITSYSMAPLRLSSVLGFGVSILSLCYMVFVFARAMLYGDPVAGYPTIMTVLLFLGGVQLISLGIIGEYLGRVFNESKKRPLYLIDEIDGERVRYETRIEPVEKIIRK